MKSSARIELDAKKVAYDAKIVLSPLKYFGNRGHKQEDIFYLIDLHRSGKKYECCYDLFAGSGSMTLAAMSFDIADAYVMNDLYPPLQIFWQQVKSSPKALIADYSNLLKKYLHSKNPSAFYARCQAHFNAITKNQKPIHDLTHYAALFSFLINHANHGMPFLSTHSLLQCERALQLPDLWSGQKEFKEAVLKASHLFNKHNVSFTSQDFSKMTTITQNDVVLLDPPYPDMEDAEEKPEHHIYQRSVAKYPLSEQLKDYIENLEKKGTPFLMFYGVLGMQNTCPIVYPQGHVLRLSGSATGPFQYYVEHLYVSPLLVPYIQQAQSRFPDRIQPSFPRLFETHAQCGEYKNGNKVALAWGLSDIRTRTYAEVNASANVLANYLQRRLGKKSEALIAVYLERGPALFITLMAVMKAGAAFLPLERDTGRLSIDASYKLIQQSGADGLIVSLASWNELQELKLNEKETPIDWSKLIVIDLDPDELVFAPEKLQAKWTATLEEKSSFLPTIIPNHLAYVIYTSGSTGEAKGVEILHRGLPYAFTSHQDLLNLGPHDRVLQFASIGFDASLMEMMMAWGAGGSLYLANKTQFDDTGALTQFIKGNQITVTIQTPKKLSTLTPEEFPDLRSVLIVGDVFGRKLSDRWLYRKTPSGNLKRDVVNGYGLTETTICTSLELCDEKKELTIGKPILGLELYLRQLAAEEKELDLAPEQWIKQGSLDEKREPELGALYATGPCVANGYWKRPHLTEQRFKLFSLNGREQVLYKTGDVGYYTSDGRIIFKNRTDRQVKIRGQRVDLGEVEGRILKYVQEVQEVRVIAVPDSTDKALVAYLVPKIGHQDLVIEGQEPGLKSLDSLIDILKILRSNMPEFMCPALSYMKWVGGLFFKNNDKKSYDDEKMVATWPAPCFKIGTKEEDAKFEATLSVSEKSLLQWLRDIWIQALEIPEDFISYSARFNEYGGNSLKTELFIGHVNEKIKEGQQPQWEPVLKKLSPTYLLSASLSGLVEKLAAENKQDTPDAKTFFETIFASPLPLDEKLFSVVTGISNDKIIKKLAESPIFIESLGKPIVLKIKDLPAYAIHSLLGDADLDYESRDLMRNAKVNYTFLSTPTLEEEKSHPLPSSHWIDKLINYHLNTIKKKHDQGSYWFIGWSSGGWIAKLMASRLRAKGKRVFVFLLDTECPVLLRDKGTADLYSCLTVVGEKINHSISLYMGKMFPKLSFVPDFSVGADPVTLSRQFFESALKEFSTNCKSFRAKQSANPDRIEKIIRSAQKIYEAELQYKGPMSLEQDDFLIVAESKEKKVSTTRNEKTLGWEVKENNVAYVQATHFTLLNEAETLELLEKKLFQQFKTLHMPYFSALAYTLQNEDKEAIVAWNKVLQHDARNEAAYFLQAQCKFRMQDYQGVVKNTTVLIKLDATNIEAYILRGEANWRLKNYREVVNDANKVVNQNKKKAIRKTNKNINRDKYMAYAYLLRAKAKFVLSYVDKTKFYNDVIDDLTYAITLDSSNPDTYIFRGGLRLLVSKDYDRTIEDMTKAIALDDKNVMAYYFRGQAHVELRECSKAIVDITRVMEFDSDKTEAYFLRGQAKLGCKDFEGVIDDIAQVIKRDVANAKAYVLYGFAKYNLGDYDYTLKAFHKALQLDPMHASVYYFFIAQTNFIKNEYKGALKAINECIKLNKINVETFKFAEAYVFRAHIQALCQKNKEAIEDLNESIKLGNNNADAYLMRGILKSQQEDYQEAIKDFTMAFDRGIEANLRPVLEQALIELKQKMIAAEQDKLLQLANLEQHPSGSLKASPDSCDVEPKRIGIFHDRNKFTEVEKREFKETYSDAVNLINKLYPTTSEEHKNAKAKAEKMQLKDLAQLKAWVDAMNEELFAKEGQTLGVKAQVRFK